MSSSARETTRDVGGEGLGDVDEEGPAAALGVRCTDGIEATMRSSVAGEGSDGTGGIVVALAGGVIGCVWDGTVGIGGGSFSFDEEGSRENKENLRRAEKKRSAGGSCDRRVGKILTR
jgi:hypothetical protein